MRKLSDKELEVLSTSLMVSQEPSRYAFGAKPNIFYLYDTQGNYVYVPFSYRDDIPRPERETFEKRRIVFEGELREEQKVVKSEAINILNKKGSVIISANPAFGKTCLSIYIASKIGMKTLVICNRVVLIKQWKESILKFCPTAKVQILSASDAMKDDIDFYIMNATNVPKHGREFYKGIGFLCVDEMHLIMAERLSTCMKYILPRYLLGLSATPYRNDGLDILIDMYFGKEKITRKLYRQHTVYKVKTDFKPEVVLNRMGKVDWGSVIESQCSNTKRNELIISVIKYFSDRVFLVLCKRVAQANYLIERLKEEKEDVTSLVGSQQEFQRESRILVGTCQKCSTGFDHQRLNAMILASDVEQYFVQYLGRVFRTKEVTPLIFDFVDNYGLLEKHYKTRMATYIEHGGVVKDFFKEFPNFPK
jgi:superfamily II DNA or RNA helicase